MRLSLTKCKVCVPMYVKYVYHTGMYRLAGQ